VPDTSAVLDALIAADPSPAERWAMLTYLCGYSPDGILYALERLTKERNRG
jgi:hypothetical protein